MEIKGSTYDWRMKPLFEKETKQEHERRINKPDVEEKPLRMRMLDLVLGSGKVEGLSVVLEKAKMKVGSGKTKAGKTVYFLERRK